MQDVDARATVTITREQLEKWAGTSLTEDQVRRITRALPYSSVPDAIGEIAAAVTEQGAE